jgi:hypothetical protein
VREGGRVREGEMERGRRERENASDVCERAREWCVTMCWWPDATGAMKWQFKF